MPTVIAVDAMGSDRAPKPEVEGAILAVRQFDVRVLLVGQEERLRAELALHPAAARMPLEVVHASEVITMEEKASKAVRAKRDTSMRVGLRLVRDGKAAGFVTAGNTGAAMALAKVVLGALPGVDRPALAGAFPTEAGHAALLLDVGANVDSKPHNLVQFAIMGETYARVILGRRKPRVGLLSIGEEEVKGNELTRETLPLLKQLPLHFVGNVEGRDLFRGSVDVMVCDGFTGNVALKISEGVGQMVRSMLRQSLESTVASKVGYLLSRRAFEDFRRRLDHAEYGGAPLLGVKGACIITHGSSNNNAIKNAIRVAAEFVSGGVNARIEREIAAMAGKTAVTH